MGDRLRIVILASGSRGDVQPYCALGCALVERGHTVLVATEERMKPLVEEFGLAYHFVTGDPTEVLHTPEGVKMLADAKFMKLMKVQGESQKKWWKPAAKDYASAFEGKVDVVVASALCMTQGWCVAERARARFVPMILGPTLRTKEFPMFFIAGDRNLCCLNGWTYDVIFDALWGQEKSKVNEWRTTSLGLPAINPNKGIAGLIDFHNVPIIVACSRHFFPNGQVPQDYPDNANVLGFPYVPPAKEEAIDDSIVKFLSSGLDKRPVVYLGFGSMPAPDPQRLYNLALEACGLASCRAVLVAGWSNINTSSPADDEKEPTQPLLGRADVPRGTVLVVRACPHDWLFPRVRAIVHHCGIGTTAAALRSGVPQVPCPVMLDQPFNASRINKLGLGTKPLPFHKLTARLLANRLTEALQSVPMQEKARVMADLIAQESDAMSRACQIVETAPIPSYDIVAPSPPCCTGCRFFCLFFILAVTAIVLFATRTITI